MEGKRRIILSTLLVVATLAATAFMPGGVTRPEAAHAYSGSSQDITTHCQIVWLTDQCYTVFQPGVTSNLADFFRRYPNTSAAAAGGAAGLACTLVSGGNPIVGGICFAIVTLGASKMIDSFVWAQASHSCVEMHWMNAGFVVPLEVYPKLRDGSWCGATPYSCNKSGFAWDNYCGAGGGGGGGGGGSW